jgi:hypothetical protein
MKNVITVKFRVFTLGIIICMNATPLIGQQDANTSDVITALDLAKVLDLKLLKFHVRNASDGDRNPGLRLQYWVESFQSDGTKTTEDKISIGLGYKVDVDFVIRLPTGMNGEFGVFSEVNSSRGKSKLIVNTETQGAEGWQYYNVEKNLLPSRDTIIAIRTVGGEYIAFQGPIEESLQVMLQGKFNRLDVFKVRVEQVK